MPKVTAPGTKEYSRQPKARRESDARITSYVREGAKMDRVAPATPEEKRTEHVMGLLSNVQFKPGYLTKSQKYK